MNITEVRIKAMNAKNEKLKAFASITIEDDFVVRDLKVIVGSRGLFVAMPSRKLSDYCPKCRSKNALRSKFCSDCGNDLRKTNFGKGRSIEDEGERSNLHADIAHPVNSECRDLIQDTVVKAYQLTVAFPDKHGIFTSEEIANTDVPEITDEDQFNEHDCEPEQTIDNNIDKVEDKTSAETDSAPEENIQKAVIEPCVIEQKQDEPIKTETTSESPIAEHKSTEEKPKKKRRFGLGIFS